MSYGSYVNVIDESHLHKFDTDKHNKGDLKPRPFIFEPLKGIDLKKVLNMEIPKIKSVIFEKSTNKKIKI